MSADVGEHPAPGAAVSANGAAPAAAACPLPSEATDFLRWPWVWRAAQFFLVLSLAWLCWPSAAKVARVCLYLAAGFTLVGGWVQGLHGAAVAPVAGGYLRRWRAAVWATPERTAGPLWLLAGVAIAGGFWLAAGSSDPGRSLNAFVEKADALLVALLGFVHFRFTAARRQPFWLMGVIAESWLIGLSAVCALFVGAYGARTGWPLVLDPTRAPLGGWSLGYATGFSHLALLAVVLVVARIGGDRLWATSAADPVTASRIKASRVVLWLGNGVFGLAAVWKWSVKSVEYEVLAWPSLDVQTRATTVFAERFGAVPVAVVLAAALALVGLCGWLCWRALGQRLKQMVGAPVGWAGQAASGMAAAEQGGWRAGVWLALPLAAVVLALAATGKQVGWLAGAAAGGGVALMLWVDRRRAASGQPRRNGGLWQLIGAVVLIGALAGWTWRSAAVEKSATYRRVWWSLAGGLIAERPGGYGFGAHIYREEFQRQYGATAAGRERLQAAIPPALQPVMEPGWGVEDLAFHQKWLTWELEKGFDTHGVWLQALFEGGWVWGGLLAALGLTGVWLRGGVRAGPSRLLDGLLPALALVLSVDVPTAGLEKIAACIIAAWVAWGVAEEPKVAAGAGESKAQ